MEFTPDNPTQNSITSYKTGQLQVGTRQFSAPVIISAHDILDWPVTQYETLTAAQCQIIVDKHPEVVILGTGSTAKMIKPELVAFFSQQRIGLEIMDSRAAARTYNILLADGRNVIAAFFVE